MIQNGVILVISKSKSGMKIEDYICELKTALNSENESSIFKKDEKEFLMKLIDSESVTLFK